MAKLNIAMDYDKTYDTDKTMWLTLMNIMSMYGHKVYMITYRHPDEDYNDDFEFLEKLGYHCIFTDGKAKKQYVKEEHALDIDIWIDDNVKSIMEDSAWAGDSPGLAAWRREQEANGGIKKRIAA